MQSSDDNPNELKTDHMPLFHRHLWWLISRNLFLWVKRLLVICMFPPQRFRKFSSCFLCSSWSKHEVKLIEMNRQAASHFFLTICKFSHHTAKDDVTIPSKGEAGRSFLMMISICMSGFAWVWYKRVFIMHICCTAQGALSLTASKQVS